MSTALEIVDDDEGIEMAPTPHKKWKLNSKLKKKKDQYTPVDHNCKLNLGLSESLSNELEIEKIQMVRSNIKPSEESHAPHHDRTMFRKRSLSDPQMNELRSAPVNHGNQSCVFPLKVLCTPIVCKNVDLYKGTKLQPPPEELQKLLKVMIHFNWLHDQNIPFFLSDGMKELNISLIHPTTKLTNISISFISVCCPQLTSLALDHWKYINDNGWKTFCTSAESSLTNSLRTLSLNGVPLTSKSLGYIVSSFRQLRYLSLDSCEVMKDPRTIEKLREHLGGTLRGISLKELNLSCTTIQAISASFTKLEKLDLTVSEWDPHCDTASSDAIATIANLKNLKELILCGLSFDNDCISKICTSCEYLEVLNLTWPDVNSEYVWSVKITDAVLPDIGECTRIRELGLGYCSRIKNAQSLNTMLMCLPNLEKLNLTSVPAVCDNVIINMAENCKHMKRLKLQNCVVNPCSLFAIGKNCNQLEYLDVRGKNIQTDSAWNAIAEGCPLLQTVLGNDMSAEARLNLHFQCPQLKVRLREKKNQTIEAICEKIRADCK